MGDNISSTEEHYEPVNSAPTFESLIYHYTEF